MKLYVNVKEMVEFVNDLLDDMIKWRSNYKMQYNQDDMVRIKTKICTFVTGIRQKEVCQLSCLDGCFLLPPDIDELGSIKRGVSI